MRPEGVRARVDDSATDGMKHHSLTEAWKGEEGRAHRRSRISRFLILSNGPSSGKGAHFGFKAAGRSPVAVNPSCSRSRSASPTGIGTAKPAAGRQPPSPLRRVLGKAES